MKAAFLEAPGKFSVRDHPVPTVTADEILIRTKACGICSSELDMWEGKANIAYPRFAGHEVSGIVEDTGPDVKHLRPGDRVALYTEGGGFAEFVRAPERFAVKLGANTDFDLALGEPIACATNGVRKVRPQLNDSVCIVGCGFMGLMMLQLLKLAGAGQLIVVDTRMSTLDLAWRLGATTVINPREEDVTTRVHDLTDGKGVDIGIEAAGIQATLDTAARIVRMEGKLEIFGYHLGGTREVDWAYWNWMAFEIINGHTRNAMTYVDGMRIGLALLDAGRLQMDRLVTHRYDLDSVNDGFAHAVEKPEGFIKGVVTL